MKVITLLFISLYTLSNANAAVGPNGYYKVISDVYSASVEKGTTVLKGKATDSNTKAGIVGGIVGETNRVRYTTTNNDGNFSVNLSSKDTSFYFYHTDYKEIVCWKYRFKSQHIVTVKFIAVEEVFYDYAQPEKPVIYLYSEDEIEAELTLKPKEAFSFTYPKYENGWSVNVSQSGLVVDDVQYPYLFWEGEKQAFTIEPSESFGYFINSDSTIQFLENTLSTLGLNSTEMTDFITYWGPRITVHDFANIQFLIGDEYENQVASLQVEPKPDSQLRIYMLFQGADESSSGLAFKPSTLPIFQREGFTLIEWGGSELPPVRQSIFAVN